jgi:UDP:flavonoid glycosyltransferase YjiC (YdhE family)
MKILITTLGSRGDVQPYLALAVGLQRAGHQVTLAAPQTFAAWIQSYGVAVAPVQFNPQEAMQKLGQTHGGLRAMSAMQLIENHARV